MEVCSNQIESGSLKRLFYCGTLLLTSCMASLAAEEEETRQAAITASVFDLSLEDLLKVEVQSTSYLNTTLAETSGYTQIIQMTDINGSPAISLQEILYMYAPNAVVGYHRRSGALYGVRGILTDSNTKTTVSLDGQQLNQRMGFGYMTGMTSPLMGDIDRIEVTHGPSALTQGSGAINGFINMVPKNGKDHTGTLVNLERGFKQDAYLVEVGHGFSYGEDKHHYLYAGAYDAEGFEPDNTFEQVSVLNDDNVYGTGQVGLRLASYWNHQNFGLNSFYFENTPAVNAVETGKVPTVGYWHTGHLGLRPTFNLELTPGHKLSVLGSLLWIDFYKITPFADSSTSKAGGSERHSDITAVYSTTAFDNNEFAAGISYGKKSFREKEQFFEKEVDLANASANTSWTELGVFVEDRWSITELLSLTFGLRYDKFDLSKSSFTPAVGAPQPPPIEFKPASIDGHWSPQISLAYQADLNTVAKVSYRHGFRMPDTRHYIGEENNDIARRLSLPADFNLKPESVDTIEFNLHR